MTPVLAVVAAFLVAVSLGFVLHSRWSFRGHGKSEDRRMKIKFLLVQSSGFLLNELFTWVLTGPMHGPTWWPLVPAILVTPLATYLLNRQWVFG
jgi:putative flippase GtrA